MSGHTPGPWVVDAVGGLLVRAADGVLVADAGRWISGDGWSPESRPNARLIAAAPALLAMCELLTEQVGVLVAAAQVDDDAALDNALGRLVVLAKGAARVVASANGEVEGTDAARRGEQ